MIFQIGKLMIPRDAVAMVEYISPTCVRVYFKVTINDPDVAEQLACTTLRGAGALMFWQRFGQGEEVIDCSPPDDV